MPNEVFLEALLVGVVVGTATVENPGRRLYRRDAFAIPAAMMRKRLDGNRGVPSMSLDLVARVLEKHVQAADRASELRENYGRIPIRPIVRGNQLAGEVGRLKNVILADNLDTLRIKFRERRLIGRHRI
jgi:hypothetical protein